MKLDPYLSHCNKDELQVNQDLTLKPKVLNVLEESTGSTLQDVSAGKDFLNFLHLSRN